MSRIAKTQPVNKQMYRHFAIITVMLTLVLAIFADGSNRADLSDRMRTERQREELAAADASMFGKHKLGGTNSAGRMQSHSAEGGSTDESGTEGETIKTVRPAQYRGDGGSDEAVMITYNDMGVVSLPPKAGVIVSGSRALPPGLGPMPTKGGPISGKKQGPLPGAARVPSQSKRDQLVNSGFQDAGLPTQ
jgi:hypothetical protein